MAPKKAEAEPVTIYTGISAPWASASNTPFRYRKKESFKDGCHTPLIVHCPKGLWDNRAERVGLKRR